jgi:hypothetical protein
MDLPHLRAVVFLITDHLPGKRVEMKTLGVIAYLLSGREGLWQLMHR